MEGVIKGHDQNGVWLAVIVCINNVWTSELRNSTAPKTLPMVCTLSIICDATPRNQAECEKNIFEIFAVLESTHFSDNFGINFMKNGLELLELQPMGKI